MRYAGYVAAGWGVTAAALASYWWSVAARVRRYRRDEAVAGLDGVDGVGDGP